MDPIDPVLNDAEGRVAPAVSAGVWRDGRRVYARDPGRVYDLASLTKVLCTAELAVRAFPDLDRGHPLLPAGVTLRHLLQHASGWPAWRPFHAEATDRADLVRRVLATPPEAPPGARHVYSDLGFIALGAVLEAEAGARLDRLWAGPLRWGDPRAEATGAPPGVVHDDNARRMDGVAPHAGLFGTVDEVAAVVHGWLDGSRVSHPLARRAFSERGPGSHALGWDTPSPGGRSTAGAEPPADAVGHLGFTGTSVWLSPERGVVAVLLTNRVALTTDREPINTLRRAFHGLAWTRGAPPPARAGAGAR